MASPLTAFPVRVRGEVVAGSGAPVRALPDDFVQIVVTRLNEVIATAQDGFLSVYITLDQPHAPQPIRPEEV